MPADGLNACHPLLEQSIKKPRKANLGHDGGGGGGGGAAAAAAGKSRRWTTREVYFTILIHVNIS